MAGPDMNAQTTRQGLQATGIVKRYAGVPALRGVDVHVRPGHVVGLVGHNGAGKSTLMKSLSGAIVPDSGSIVVDGDELQFSGPAESLAAGVSTVYQELSLHSNLTVVQNVFLGREITTAGRLDMRTMRREAEELVAEFELDVDVMRPLADYSVAVRQLLEVAVACGRHAKYLLLDEPTTSLEGGQVDRLLAQVTRLANEGMGIVLVDHKLDELYQVAHEVVVLVDGEVRIEGPSAEVDRDEIVRAIAGDEAAEHLSHLDTATADAVPAQPQGEPALRVRGLTTPALSDVTLDAYPGRVLGIYGLIGSGRTEFLRSLVGLDGVQRGSIELLGEPYSPHSPADAQSRGLVYLTEERKVDGIVPGLDSATNVALPFLRRFSRWGVLNREALTREAQDLMDRFNVRGDRSGPVASLSGGNQQKVLFARALGQRPTVLLLDEPTKGVDIGVKGQIHRELRMLAHEEGMTIIVVSSEEEEVLDVADDVVTFAAGVCTGERYARRDLTIASLREMAWRHAA